MQYKVRKGLTLTALAACFLLPGLSPAQSGKLYKLVDEQGNVTFTDIKPEADASGVEELDTSLSAAGEDATADLDQLAEDAPITFYSASDCAACDMVRTYLKDSNLPYTEVEVADDYDAQQQMKQAVGNLNVPTVTVGERTLTGFNASALDAILDVAGYPVGEAAAAPAPQPANEESVETDETGAADEDLTAPSADEPAEELENETDTTNGEDAGADT